LSGGESDFDMYAARKNGKPKDDYPSKYRQKFNCLLDFDVNVIIQGAGVKNNHFSVIFADKTVISVDDKKKTLDQEDRDPKKSYAF
jgi:hypothetical protein